MTTALEHSCDREIRAIAVGWAMSGWRQDGERWECSCGKVYIHICDEAEGCHWALAEGAGDEGHIVRGEE